MRRVRFLVVLIALAATQARAEFPEQSIKVIVPFAPGGFVDGFARIFTDRLGTVLGKCCRTLFEQRTALKARA